MAHRIEPLAESHDLRRFRCGKHQLDSFLKRHALDNQARGLGNTYVAVDSDAGGLLGYVTVCAGAISFDYVPESGLPHYPIPALLIARLAVDRRAQGRGIGSDLVIYALRLAVGVSEALGLFAVTVDAMDEDARQFYLRRFEFRELLDDRLHLFVTLAKLRASGYTPLSQSPRAGIDA